MNDESRRSYRSPSTAAADDVVLASGKYYGRSLGEIARLDARYVGYLATRDAGPAGAGARALLNETPPDGLDLADELSNWTSISGLAA